jgi:hypothetical protein
VLIDFARPPEPMAADLSYWRGVFADGYTPEAIADVLDAISEKLGISLHCLWEYIGDEGLGGKSDLIAVIDGEVGFPAQPARVARRSGRRRCPRPRHAP